MKFYKHKRVSRNRISPLKREGLTELHRNISPDIITMENLQSFLSDLDIDDLIKYPEIEPLVEQIGQLHEINKNCILITSGIDGGLKTVFEMCTADNDSVATYFPTYAMYKVYSEAYNVNLIDININGDDTKKEIYNAINKNISILFLPNPNLPVEFGLSQNDISNICVEARKKEVLVVVDEAYAMFGLDTVIPLMSKHDNLIIARTFSKAIGFPGIRLGYLIANSNLIEYLESRRNAHETNALSIAAGRWAINNFSIVKSNIDKVIETREWFKQELIKNNISAIGMYSNTVILDFYNKDMADKFTEFMKDQGYIVKNNYPSMYHGFVSITIGTKDLMIRVMNSIKVFMELNNDKFK